MKKLLETLTTTNSSSFSCLSDILHSHKGTNRNTKVHQSFKSRSSRNPIIKMLSKVRKWFLPTMSTWNTNRKKGLNPVPYTKHGEASNMGTAHKPSLMCAARVWNSSVSHSCRSGGGAQAPQWHTPSPHRYPAAFTPQNAVCIQRSLWLRTLNLMHLNTPGHNQGAVLVLQSNKCLHVFLVYGTTR